MYLYWFWLYYAENYVQGKYRHDHCSFPLMKNLPAVTISYRFSTYGRHCVLMSTLSWCMYFRLRIYFTDIVTIPYIVTFTDTWICAGRKTKSNTTGPLLLCFCCSSLFINDNNKLVFDEQNKSSWFLYYFSRISNIILFYISLLLLFTVLMRKDSTTWRRNGNKKTGE